MTVGLTAATLSEFVEAEVPFNLVGGGEGRQAGAGGDFVGLEAGNRDDNRGGGLAFTTFCGCEPARFLGEDQAGDVCGEFLSN